MSNHASSNHPMLRLTEGGPTYRIEKRLGLIREQSPRVVRRVFFFIVVTWVPLLVLSALQGTAIGDSVVVPFLRDIAVHARLLLAMPLLILAEVLLGPHLAEAAIHFVDSGLVLEEDFKRFDNAVERALRWRDSLIPELVLLLLAYTFATISRMSMAIHVSTWHAITTDPTASLTWAGWWLVLFCTPFFQFLLLRWFWRLFLWGQFLWRMSKLHLQLIPTHPVRSVYVVVLHRKSVPSGCRHKGSSFAPLCALREIVIGGAEILAPWRLSTRHEPDSVSQLEASFLNNRRRSILTSQADLGGFLLVEAIFEFVLTIFPHRYYLCCRSKTEG
jgi:hypothetical protein